MLKKNINKPKPHIRQPKVYLESKRVCCKCGSNKTNDTIINDIRWHRALDEQGKWVGKWSCNSCYNKEYQEKRRQDACIMRQELIILRAESNDKLNDDSDIKCENVESGKIRKTKI